MKIIKVVLVLIVFCNAMAIAQQGITNWWYMGYGSFAPLPFGGTNINFINGQPDTSYIYRVMNFGRAHSNISDGLGNMLFYTNGYSICDATDSIMQNGDTIAPTADKTTEVDGVQFAQGCLVIPNPASDNKYYLFHVTVDDAIYYLCLKFYYSEIDMTLNNGLGGVTTKHNVLINDTMQWGKITACKHGNGRDWWVVCLRQNSNIIYSFLVTPYGINGPFSQAIGQVRKKGLGQVKFSRNGNKFAFVNAQYTTTGNLEIFDFDRCTGLFSNPIWIILPEGPGAGGGLEFSPTDQYLYVSNIDSIYQYDVTVSNIDSTKIIVAVWDSFFNVGGIPVVFDPMELAPDGKIYICSGNSTEYMHVISNPDSQGLACNFIQRGLPLPTYYFNTLPNHPNYFLGANGLCNNLSFEGLESWKVKKVTVFGNPTHDKFTLWFPVDKDVGVLEIYDVNGACIRTERVAQWSQYKSVDIGLFAEGVYFCRMVWPDGEGSCRVVKLE